MKILNTDIFIRGNYGPDNFGDDILLLTIINLVNELAPSKKIHVEVKHPDIVRSWINYATPFKQGQFDKAYYE